MKKKKLLAIIRRTPAENLKGWLLNHVANNLKESDIKEGLDNKTGLTEDYYFPFMVYGK